MPIRLSLLPLLAAAALCAGCARPLPEGPQTGPSAPEELVTVHFRAAGAAGAKATGIREEDETAVGRWTLFVFEDGGTWYHHETAPAGGALSMQLRAGRAYTCHAIVNYPVTGTGAFNPAAVRTPSDITGKVASLGDNAVGSLLMYGAEPLTPGTGTAPVTIRVRRIVSRIDLPGVAVDFSGKPDLAAMTFTLRHLYVTNAYRTTRYGSDYTRAELSGARSSWYNSGGWHRGEAGEGALDALLGDRDIDEVVTAGNPYTTPHSFYALPNGSLSDDDQRQIDPWTRRCTRLVIEATLGSETVYYPVTIPAMTRNCIYSVTGVVIHGKGSPDPEVLSGDGMDSTVTVLQDGWDDPGEELDL